mgnify:CR=1 FL=1
MKQLNKCEYCHKPLTVDDSVFIRVTRYDLFGRRIKKKAFCTNCWDHTTIFVYGIGGKHE